jgi:DNA-directed RNA polymerase subunit D
MDTEIEEETEDVLKLRIEGINEASANALRRSMVSGVPTLAVKHLDVIKNESGIFNEALANRVGQVPFTLPNSDDPVHIAVKKEGPCKVLASDIQTDDEEVEPVNPGAEITTLKEGQDLEFEGEADTGYGSEHAKHQGATVGYEKEEDGRYLFRIESTSGYSNRELLHESLDHLVSDLDKAEAEL